MFGVTARAGRAGRTALRAAGLAALTMLVFGLAGQARAETRVLKLYHLHTHEKASFAYKVNGRFDPSELKKINWFLRDWRKEKATPMDPRLLDLIWEAYQQSGSHGSINVICGYRSPATNSMLRSRSSGVAKKSQHMLGRALDFYIPDVPLKKLREIGLKMQVGGVGYYPTSGSPFVHFDVGNARHWPRMTRRQLLAVFPHGHTVHVPSDGKPLPGYQEALADYQKRRSASEVMVANASSGSAGGGKTLLAMLFGGGNDTADEAEDEADAAVPARRAAPAALATPAATPAPAMVAGADAAVPRSRPTQISGGATAVAAAEDFDTGRPGGETTQVAALEPARIPVPRWAPGRAVPAEVTTTTTMTAAAEAAPENAAAPDAVGAMVAALEEQARQQAGQAKATPAGAASDTQLAYAVPMPQERPLFDEVLKPAEADRAAAASLSTMEAVKRVAMAGPAGRPGAGPEAPLASGHKLLTEAAARPVTAPPRRSQPAHVASLEGKGGRVIGASAGASRPRVARTIDPQEAIRSRIAVASLVTDPDERPVEVASNAPDAQRLVGALPKALYEKGFLPNYQPAPSDRFSGSAVQFFPLVKVKP